MHVIRLCDLFHKLVAFCTVDELYHVISSIVAGVWYAVTDPEFILLNRHNNGHPYVFNYLHQVFIPLHCYDFKLYV